MRRAGAKIRLGQAAERETIEREKPDVLIVAVGAAPLIPDIPGMVGCETAEHVLQRSSGVTGVTVFETLDRMAGNVPPTYRPFFLARLKKEGVRMVPGARVIEIDPRGTKIEGAQGTQFVEGSVVVLATGYKADGGMIAGFTGIVPETYVIGDCASARLIQEALEEGFATGRSV